MTFLQAVDPKSRVYINFVGMPATKPMPSDWTVRYLQGDSRCVPEIVSPGWIRNSETLEWNNNTRHRMVNNYEVSTDNQMNRSILHNVPTALFSGLIIKADVAMANLVLALTTTDGNSQGLWTIINNTATRVATFSTPNYAAGVAYCVINNGNIYRVVRAPNADGSGGTQICTWTDTNNTVKSGPQNRRGGFLLNSDANAGGAKNWGNGWRDFDFRDVGWAA